MRFYIFCSLDMKANRVNLLIQHGADLSIKNNAGLSGLHFIYKKVPQCMKALGILYVLL